MNKELLIFFNLTIMATFIMVVVAYFPNIPGNDRKMFWGFNVLFVVLRQFFIISNFYDMPLHQITIYWVFNSLLSASISCYMIYYLLKNYGHREVIRQDLLNHQLKLYAEFLPFSLSNMSELTGIKGYRFDIDSFLATCKDEWQYLTPEIKYRKWSGKMKFGAKYAIELEIIKDVEFPIQHHKYNEIFEVMTGRVEVKKTLIALPGDKPMIVLENDMHYYKCTEGTRHISYFVENLKNE